MEDTRLLFKSDYEDDIAAYYKRGYAGGTLRTVTPTRKDLHESISQKVKGGVRSFWKPYQPRFTAQESVIEAQKIWDDKESFQKLSLLMGEIWSRQYRDRIILNHVENKV